MNKRFSNRKFIPTVSLMLLSMCMQAQQIHIISIQDAISIANKNNLQVKNALLDYKIQEQTNRNITALIRS